jgi:hypothetical protein
MEMRVIVWNTRDTAPKDSYTSDVYVSCEMLGSGDPKVSVSVSVYVAVAVSVAVCVAVCMPWAARCQIARSRHTFREKSACSDFVKAAN